MKRGILVGGALLLILSIVPCFLMAQSRLAHQAAYGQILSQDTRQVKGAVVDKIVLYPQQSSFSKSRIARNGLLIRYKQAQATIILCHGFMCDKYDVGFLRDWFNNGQYNILAFDFRAHGERAEGQRCTFGRDEAYDVLAVAEFLKNYGPTKGSPIFVYGFSMGAVSAIEAASKAAELNIRNGKYPQLFQAMVLDCPFDSSENVIRHGLNNVKLSILGYEFNMPGKKLLERYAFHPYVQSLVKLALKTITQLDTHNIDCNICRVFPAESVKKVESPCFFIHCKNDKKVTVASVKRVFNNAAGYKKLWITNGRRHFDSLFYNPERYRAKVVKFFDEALHNQLYAKENNVIKEDPEEV